MKQKLWGKNIEKCCAACEIGKPTADGDGVLCEKKGIMQPSSVCRKFRYDPFKRRPPASPLPEIQTFSQDDFSLDI